jgi:uncharacterized membrane protein
MVWSKTWRGKLLERGLHLLEMAVGFGFVTTAAVAAVVGKFILAGILLALALAVLLRFIRRPSPRKLLNTPAP